MSVYSIFTDKGEIIQLGYREGELPLISCEVPIADFLKMFPAAAQDLKHIKVVKIIEGLYDDEITNIVNQTIHLKTKKP